MHKKSKSNVDMLSRKIQHSVIERNFIQMHKQSLPVSPTKYEPTQQRIDRFRTEQVENFSYDSFYNSLKEYSESKQRSPVILLK